MGYSTTAISPESAMIIIKVKRVEVDSASESKYFSEYPRMIQITSAEKSDHGHIILRLKKGGFVDYKLV